MAATVMVASVMAAPRDGSGSNPRPPRNQPSATVPQTEPMDLDEGKTGPQMFSTACVVCHQSPQGLAKGRSAGQLAGFLRQHYTTGTGQAGVLANYLTTGGLERGNAAPVRTSVPDKPEKPEPASRRQRPDDARGKPEPDVATTNPNRRIRLEDGSTQPVDGLVVLPPGSDRVPDVDAKPDGKPDRRRDARPSEPAHPTRQRQPKPADVKPAESKPAETKPAETKPAEAKPAEPAKPVEAAKPAEAEPAPAAPTVQAEAPRPPRDPAAAHSPLTEDRPKPEPSQVQEIPL